MSNSTANSGKYLKIIIPLMVLFGLGLAGKVWFFKPGARDLDEYVETRTKDEIQALMALPYMQGYYPVPEKTGVLRYDRSLAYPGYNLYSSGHTGAAYLIDMKGKVLHEWTYPLEKIWPELARAKIAPFWENIYLYPNGDLLAVFNRGGMIKIDKDSQLLWSFPCKAHHDIDLDEQGNIYTLTEDDMVLKQGVSIVDNSILVLSPDGNPIKKLSLFKLMLKSKHPVVQKIFKRVIGIALNGGEDVFHSNTLEIFDGNSAYISPIFKKGNILTSMLTISTIAVIDPNKEDFDWILGPYLWYQGQHNPALLENSNILIFDNHLNGSKEQSRVLEFDPMTKKVIWEYKEKGFYTDTHGANARLPNGNTLIIESNKGRVFEVTKERKIVWEFLNPHTTGEKNELIAAVFALYRIHPDSVSWMPK